MPYSNDAAISLTALSGKAAIISLCLLSAACGEQPPVGNSSSQSVEKVASAEREGLIASVEPDWPQWGGRRRDSISGEQGLLPRWPEGGPRLVWKLSELGQGWSSPIIVRDRLYVTGDVEDDLVVYAFDLDGKPIWRSTNGRAWKRSYPGARSCCVCSDGKLYHLNAHGRVACLDVGTGKEQWSRDLREQFQTPKITWGLSECPLVDGSRLIVTPVGGGALVAAFDKDSGRTEWTTPPLADDHPTYSSAILFRYAGRRLLANCTAEHGFGVDADTGELLWTVPLENRFGVTPARPVYGNGRVFYVTPYSYGSCWELRPTAGGFQAEKVWETTLDTCTGAVLLKDGLLFGSGYKKHKSWLCLDWTTGEIRYELRDLTTGSAVYADGRLYSLAEDGRVALLKPTDEKFDMVGEFRLLNEKARDAWAHPILLDGRLYLRYHDSLWCYDVRGR